MIALFTARRIRAGFVMLLLLIGSMLFAQPPAGLAQDAALEWSRPIPLSGALGGSRYPALVTDDSGQLLLLWSVSADGSTTIFVSRFDGQVWQRPVDVLLGGPNLKAQIDGRDRIHLMYLSNESQLLTTAEFGLADSARGWSYDLTVNADSGGVGADFVYGDNDTLYTVWIAKPAACESCYSVSFIKYAKDTLSDLSFRVISESTSTPQQRVQLLRAADGTLFAMWDTAAQRDLRAGIRLQVSENDGDTWLNEPRGFATTDADIRQPLFFVDNANNLVLVYNYGVRDETYFSVSSDRGETWTPPAPVPGLYANKLADASDYFAQITDSTGTTHLVASGRASPVQQSPGLYHLTWNGTAWGAPEELYNEGSVPEFPAVTLADGNRLHVSFATRDQSPVSGDVLESYRVWYTTALTTAPAATRVPLPTFTTTPTPTATPEATGTATPRPSATPLPGDSTTTNPPANQADPILPLLIVIVPVVVILVAVVVWASVFRRRT